MLERGICSGCGAAVVWARTASGKPIPMEARPKTRGWVIDANGKISQHDVYDTHFASCPKASEFRKAAR